MQTVPVCSNAPDILAWDKADAQAGSAFDEAADEAAAVADTDAQRDASSPLLRL
jgi:hypothetical protein